MKKITSYEFAKKFIVLIIITLMVISCGPSRSKQRQQAKQMQKPVVSTRIQLVERVHTYDTFLIIKVDGHEYLSAHNSGLVHLESCKHEEHK